MVAVLVLALGFDISILWATLTGLMAGIIIGFTSEYFTSDAHKPVIETAKVSGSGAAITIITGYSYGLISIVPSIVGIVAATLISYFLVQNSGSDFRRLRHRYQRGGDALH